MRSLVAIPVYNEQKYVRQVLERVLSITPSVVVIDDGSTDQTPEVLASLPVDVIRHGKNRGYGRSMRDAFRWAVAQRFDWLVTMDCDEQHEPAAIPHFLEAAALASEDIISGSRYLVSQPQDDAPPADRRLINMTMTEEINRRLSTRLGTRLTDAFCGFKAYRVAALRTLRLTETGYAFPMQFWVQAAAHGLKVRELPVRLIYNDMTRTFGGVLDDPEARLAHYRAVLHRALCDSARRLPPEALLDLCDGGSRGCSEGRSR
jgi:dolichol-phosphate mannosyltransferase